jgi:hypothetical protein
MGKSISAKRKRPGRPATGVDPMVGLRLAPDLIKEVDEWAAAHEMTRSDAIRQFIELGLRKGKR